MGSSQSRDTSNKSLTNRCVSSIAKLFKKDKKSSTIQLQSSDKVNKNLESNNINERNNMKEGQQSQQKLTSHEQDHLLQDNQIQLSIPCDGFQKSPRLTAMNRDSDILTKTNQLPTSNMKNQNQTRKKGKLKWFEKSQNKKNTSPRVDIATKEQTTLNIKDQTDIYQNNQENMVISKDTSSKTNHIPTSSLKNNDSTIRKGKHKKFEKSENKEHQNTQPIIDSVTKQQMTLSVDEQTDLNNQEYMVIGKGDISMIESDLSQEQSNKQKQYEQNSNIFNEVNSLINLDQQKLIQIELQKKGYFLKNYLAKGGEGIIFDGYDKHSQEVVFKILLDIDKDELEEEISIMKKFEGNLNIITFIELVSILPINVSVLILEKCKHSLKKELELFQTAQKTFTLKKLFSIILDLFDGLIQLRIFKIMHLDIKPDNILLKSDGKWVYADFGLSQQYSDDRNKLKIKGFTRKFAPVEQQLEKNTLIQYKTDTYSLGKTIEQIIEIFKGLNQNYEIIDEFQIQILDKIIQEDIEKREDCSECHIKLLVLLIKNSQQQNLEASHYLQILIRYSNKMENIIIRYPYDQNKDIKYFKHIRITYCEYQIKILCLIKDKHQTNLQDNHLLFTSIQKIIDLYEILNVYYSDIGDYISALNYQLLSLKLSRSISQENKNSITFANTILQVGESYRKIGNYVVALSYFQDSLKMTLKNFKGNHTMIATTLFYLGRCYFNIGDYENGLRYSLDSLQMNKELFKENHADIARSLESVAICYQGIGDSTNALSYSHASLKMREELYQGIHPDISSSLTQVSICYRDIGDYANALNYSLRALEIAQKCFIDLLKYINTVAVCYLDLKEFAKALNFLLDVLKMAKERFKGNHPDIAKYLSNLGQIYRGLNEFENALDVSLDGLKMAKELFKGNHPQLAKYLRNVGSCYCDLNDYANALNFLLDALKMAKELFKGNHPETVNYLNHAAYCYILMGEFANAMNFSLDALKMAKELFKGNHLVIAHCLNNIGQCYLGMNEFANAFNFLLDALKMAKELFKGNHPDIASYLNNVAGCYTFIGEFANALNFQLEALKMAKELFKENHPNTVKYLNDAALSFILIGQFSNALNFLKDALKMTKELSQENHVNYPTSLTNIGIYYLTIGDYSNALNYFLGSLKITKQLQKGNDRNILIVTNLLHAANCFYSIGDSMSGLILSSEAFNTVKELANGNHFLIVMSLNTILKCKGNIEDLGFSYLEPLKMSKELFKGNNLIIVDSILSLGLFFKHLGNSKNFVRYNLEGLIMLKEIFKVNNTQILQIQLCVGLGYRDIGDPIIALSYLLDALKIARELYKEGHPQIEQILVMVEESCINIESANALSYLLG